MRSGTATNSWTAITATWSSKPRSGSTNANRARGTHNVELRSEIVAELTRANMSDQWIMRHIGMDRDELLRLKQITGLADLFADKEFSLGDTDEDSVEEMLEV